MYKKESKRGFTLIELLVVVAIIGVLSAMAIISYTKYITKAKEEKYANNEIVLVEAAKSYLSTNSNLKPKNIGESIKITAKDLKTKEYITSDLTNIRGEGCMNNSYVYVHKYDQNKYAYKGFIYCGSEKAPDSVDLPTPTITKTVFSNMEKVDQASFSMKINGSDDKKVELDSYLFTISVNKNDGNNMHEVYNSGSKLAQGNKTIEFKNLKLKQYIDITNTSSIVITVSVKNVLGGVTEKRFNYTYKDTTKPQCGETDGEAVDDSDWVSKKDITDLKKQRTITIGCQDGLGSGCVRSSFSSTWPKSNLKSIRRAGIAINDNANNKETCNVLVNIDVDAPTIDLKAYNKINDITASTKAENWNNKEIIASAYSDNVRSWLNKDKYGGKVVYKASLSDNFYLYKYKWETNQTMLPARTNIGVLKSNLHGPESKEETFNTVNGTAKNITIEFNKEGMRYGKLTVYDRAGNEAVIEIYANIDKTPPDKPQISFNQYRSSDDSSIGNPYTPSENKWSNLSIISRIEGQKTDSTHSLSGWMNFIYQYKDKDSFAGETAGERFDIKNEGKHSIKYKSCDIAGNCSDYTIADYINIDKTIPDCTISNESTKWQNTSRTITYGCSDSLSKCKTGASGYSQTYSSTKKTDSVTYTIEDNAGNSKKCSYPTVNVYVDTTPPKVKLSSKKDGYKLEATATDSHSGMGKYKWGTDSYKNTSSESFSKNYAADSKDEEMEFCAKDAVGNEKCAKIDTYAYCDKEKGEGIKTGKGDPYGSASEQSTFTTEKNKISSTVASTTVFNHVAFHWVYNKHQCKKDKTSSVENRAYFTLKEVGCVCGVDRYVNSHYCSNKTYDVGSKTHNKIGTSGEAYIAYEEDYCPKVKVDAVINKNVKKVCNNGTHFSKNGSMEFHGYTFYKEDSSVSSKKSLKVTDDGVWTYNNSSYDGDLSDSAMCKKICS